MVDETLVIGHLYAAFNAREADEVLGYLHPEVEWPNGWEGGYVRGRDAVRAYWIRQWKEIDPKVTPLGIHVEEDGQLTVRVHQVVHDRNGKLLSDTELEHVYRTRDGLFDRMEIREQPERTS
jgi:ketosteroid isomerase-like protein